VEGPESVFLLEFRVVSDSLRHGAVEGTIKYICARVKRPSKGFHGALAGLPRDWLVSRLALRVQGLYSGLVAKHELG